MKSVNMFYRVDRFDVVLVTGSELVAESEPVLKNVNIEADKTLAVVFQHEIDHTRGILISEIGTLVQIW